MGALSRPHGVIRCCRARAATALRAAFAALRTGGRLICVAYTGHPGGMDESDVVLAFAAERTSAGDAVEKIGHVPNPGKPWVLSVTKR